MTKVSRAHGYLMLRQFLSTLKAAGCVGRYVLTAALFTGAFFFAGQAHAGLTVNSVTLDGGSTTTVTPGASIVVAISETNTGGSNWRSTRFRVTDSGGTRVTTCVNTPDHNSDGTFAETFSITAPAAVDIYDVAVRAYEDSTCGGNNSNTVNLNGGIVVAVPVALPTVTTGAASALTTTGATLNGTVSSNGASTAVTFDYGTSIAYGSTATATASPLVGGAVNQAVSVAIAGLSCGTTYQYRAKGVNSVGTATGSNVSFSTAACPVPVVTSINRVDFNPARAGFPVSWTVVFNSPVLGVDVTDFALVQTGGATGANLSGVTGSGTTWTVTANTGTAGTLGLNLVDNDSIVSGSTILGGAGAGNGNFTGQTYTLIASPCTGAADILFCDDFERSNAGSVGNGWTITPANAGNCSGTGGNTACAGIDSDIPPFTTYANPRANPTRSMFTRWAAVSVDSKTIDLSTSIGAQLSFWMRRGRDTFSECPEAAGENYLVRYWASDNTWKTLAQYPSSPSANLCDGQIFTPTIELPPDALHANFKMRFYQPSGSGDSGSGGAPGVRGYDYWHMDDVVIRKVTAPTFVGAFCDNFEAGLSRWSISAEGFSTGNIGDASIGTLAFQSSSHALDMRWGYVTASTFKTNLTGISGDITFWVKSGAGARDPTANQNLIVEYLNSSGVWTPLTTYLGSLGAGVANAYTAAIPADAKHAGFRLRFRMVAGGGYDKSYWHIDDVCVGNAVATTDLALTKTGDATLIPGTNTTYTLRVTNNGPDALSGTVQVVDTLPTGLTFVSGSGSGWSCSANGQIVTCNYLPGAIANGAVAPNLVITAAVAAGVTGSITNTAVVTGSGNDLVPGNNTASVTSGNFIPSFIFTNGACVDGIAVGQSGQSCSMVNWSSMVAGQTKGGIYLTAVNASGIPTRLSASASTSVNIQFGLSCHDPVANAGVQATFSAVATALPLCTGGGADPTTWSAAISLTFLAGAPSVANAYTFGYADVGLIELFMRNSVATSQVGTSGSFVVKPAGFVLSSIKCTTYAADSCASASIPSPGNNPGATAAGGLAFIQAGQPFSATVTALTVSGKTKADAGTAVNCTSNPGDCTPNFGKEQVPESVGLDVTNFVAGMVTPPDLVGSFGPFSGGIATGTAFSWDEVGIITLTPAIKDSDYLGALDVVGTASGTVGRFFPSHFNTVVTQVSGVPMGCPDGLCPATYNGMVYAGQPFSVTVTAKNTSNATTVNYNATTGFAKATTLSPVGALGTATAPTGAGTLGVASVSAFSAGTLTEVAEKYTFTVTPTSPTNIYINASDGEASSRRTANPTTTSIEGGVRVVSGRIKIPNVYGSERLQLPLTATVQYHDGTSWVPSLTDSVTSFNTNLSTAGGNLVATVIAGLPSGVSVVSPGTAAVVSGVRTFNLAAPLVGGSVELSLNAPTYLPNAGARATFGIFKSPLIYRRENY